MRIGNSMGNKDAYPTDWVDQEFRVCSEHIIRMDFKIGMG